MRKRLRPAFWIESVMACLTAFLALLTLLTPDWIEVVFDIDPDSHSGSVEWGIVVVCCVATAICYALARREWLKSPLKVASARKENI
jgi:hypothetical protein